MLSCPSVCLSDKHYYRLAGAKEENDIFSKKQKYVPLNLAMWSGGVL